MIDADDYKKNLIVTIVQKRLCLFREKIERKKKLFQFSFFRWKNFGRGVVMRRTYRFLFVCGDAYRVFIGVCVRVGEREKDIYTLKKKKDREVVERGRKRE